MAHMLPVVRKKDAKFLRKTAMHFKKMGLLDESNEMREMATRIEKIANENALAIVTTTIRVTDMSKVRNSKAKRILTVVNGKNIIDALKVLDDHTDTKGTTIGELQTILDEAIQSGAVDLHF